MGLIDIINNIDRNFLNEGRATWVIGYERDGKEYSWSTSANSSGEAQRAFEDYMEGQGVSTSDYRIKGTYQSTTNDMEEAYEDWGNDDDEPRPRDYTSDYEDTDNAKHPYEDPTEEEPSEPSPDDIIISSNGWKYNVGGEDAGHIGEFEELEDAERAIKDWMTKHKWHPRVWFQDDHGGIRPYTMDEIVEEGNYTSNLDGGLGQPKVPHAFQRKNPSDSDRKKERENATSSTGYNIAKETHNYIKKRNEILSKADSIISDVLREGRYADYAADESMTAKEKINMSIKQVNQRLYEIERMVNHAVRLRTESGIEDVFWKSTRERFGKISERMLRITTKLREFNK